MDRPAIYLQRLEDEAAEQQDAFDQIHPVIGGEPDDGYRLGVAVEDGYETERVDTLEEAHAALETMLEELGLEYDRPEDLEELVVEHRYWQDQD